MLQQEHLETRLLGAIPVKPGGSDTDNLECSTRSGQTKSSVQEGSLPGSLLGRGCQAESSVQEGTARMAVFLARPAPPAPLYCRENWDIWGTTQELHANKE